MGASASKKAPEPSYDVIPDRYKTFEQVQEALRAAGLESSNLIVAVDYTKSNEWTGKHTFRGACLHVIDPSGFVKNPYQQVIEILGQALEPFDDDHLIPAFGFGDATTADKMVFPFFPDRPCRGFLEVLNRYNEITPNVRLAGPTNFAPAIYEAINTCRTMKSYHILLIIADGQVTSEAETVRAIREASNFPLSIVMVGVGDGPWDMMENFDDKLSGRRFDNFQFVNFNQVRTRAPEYPDTYFAMCALMEVPDQYKAIRKMGLL